jgi:hypothetical protein
LLGETQNLSLGDKERLYGYLEGGGKMILTEPEALLTAASRMPGLDGQKMSKSYGNTISLREDPEAVTKKIRTMPTDPARVRRNDPGTPEKCPVWQLHQVYSGDDVKAWVQQGCTSAGIGCLECKQPVIDAVLRELAPIQERARAYTEEPDTVKNIIADGCEKARDWRGRPCATCARPWAARLDQMPQVGRDYEWITVWVADKVVERQPDVSLHDLQIAWLALMKQAKVHQHHKIHREELSVREHMSIILRRLQGGGYIVFEQLFDLSLGAQGLVVSFLALLELARESLVELTQNEAMAPIYARLPNASAV